MINTWDFSCIRCHRASKVPHEVGHTSKPTPSIDYPITLEKICTMGQPILGVGLLARPTSCGALHARWQRINKKSQEVLIMMY